MEIGGNVGTSGTFTLPGNLLNDFGGSINFNQLLPTGEGASGSTTSPAPPVGSQQTQPTPQPATIEDRLRAFRDRPQDLPSVVASILNERGTTQGRADALLEIRATLGLDATSAMRLVSAAFDRAGFTTSTRREIVDLLPFARDGSVAIVAGALREARQQGASTGAAFAQAAAAALGPLGFRSDDATQILDRALATVSSLPLDTRNLTISLLRGYTPRSSQSQIGTIVDQINAALGTAAGRTPELRDAARLFNTVTSAYNTVESIIGVFNGREGSDDQLVAALQGLKDIIGEDVANGATAAIRVYNAVQNLVGIFNLQEGSGDKFILAVNQLKTLGYIDDGTGRAILAASHAYNAIQQTVYAISNERGERGAALRAVESLNSFIGQVLPPEQAGTLTRSVDAIKNAYVIIQNLVDINGGNPSTWRDRLTGGSGQTRWDKIGTAAVSLFTNAGVFGGDFAKTAGQIIAGYKLVQNVANFWKPQSEAGSGKKALEAVQALAGTGLISRDTAKYIQAAGATYTLAQNVINGLNGSNERGNTNKALGAAQLLANLGVLGPQVSAAINTGIKVYGAVDSVVKFISAPSWASGFGAVAGIAGLIGGQTGNFIGNIATLGLGIATGGIGAILGGAFGLLSSLFGGGPKYTTVATNVDADNNGIANDTVRFESNKDDWWYHIDAATAPIENASFALVRNENTERPKGMSISSWKWHVKNGFVKPTFSLSVTYNFKRINDAPSLEMRGYGKTVNITEAQYNSLVAQFGTTQGGLAGSDARIGALRAYVAPEGTLKIKQEKKNEGMTTYTDVNGDGNRDRVTQYVKIDETNTDNSTYIELRNAAGQTWMSYAVDANGNASGGTWSANRAVQTNLGGPLGAVGWQNIGGRTVFGAVNWRLAPLTASDRLAALNYIASNPDLIAAFGPDAGAGYEHLMLNGARENRQITFDGAAFMNANPDVARWAGGDPARAAVYWIIGGRNENRPMALTRQDANGDGQLDQTKVFQDRLESTFTGTSGIQTTAVYTREGRFLRAEGDFNNDGVRDRTTLLANGDTRVEATEGTLRPVQVYDRNSVLKQLTSDLNGDGTLDTVIRNSDGNWTATLKVGGNDIVGNGPTLEDALAVAAVQTPEARLQALSYIASYADLSERFGTDAAKGFAHLTKQSTAEGRQILFDVAAYADANADLKTRFGDDKIGLVTHYITEGRAQGRVIRDAMGDVNGDGIADRVRVKGDSVRIDVKSQTGETVRTVTGADLEAAVAEANRTSLLIWIATDVRRIKAYGTDIVAAQKALSDNTAVGNPEASLDVFNFLVQEGDRFTAAGNDIDRVFASYIEDVRANSFEGQTLGDGQFINSLGQGWYQVAGSSGILNPTTGQLGAGARTGDNVGYIDAGGVVRRTLTQVQRDQLLRFTLELSNRTDQLTDTLGEGSFALRLVSEGRVIGENRYTLPRSEGWQQLSIDLNGSVVPQELLDKPFEVEIANLGQTQILFDDFIVRRRALQPPAPETTAPPGG